MSRLGFTALPLALALAAAACASASGAPAEEAPAHTTTQPIVGGTTDTTRPEVLVLRDDTLAGFRCTATLIAPNLVITARHCVGKRSTGTTLCKGAATDDGAQSLPSYAGDVEASPMYFAASPSSPLLARGAMIYDDGATTTCAHDLALIGLDRAIPGITPAQLRRTPVAIGDALVVMGFGWTDRDATVNATERMKGTTHVLALGPAVVMFQPLADAAAPPQAVAIASGEIAVSGITMTGDSGGPAFDASGRLAALVSRGYSDAYYGPATFTTLAAHLATIDAALAATGNAPALPDAGSDADTPAEPAPDAGGTLAVPAEPDRDGGNADDGFGRATSSCSATARGHRSGAPSGGLAATLCSLAVAVAARLRGRASARRPRS